MSRRSEKKEDRRRASTRQLIGAQAITDYSLITHGHGELVYFILKPVNLSVLSQASVGARIYALMNVLKGVAEIEMLCQNSRESFEKNKGKTAGLYLRCFPQNNAYHYRLLWYNIKNTSQRRWSFALQRIIAQTGFVPAAQILHSTAYAIQL